MLPMSACICGVTVTERVSVVGIAGQCCVSPLWRRPPSQIRSYANGSVQNSSTLGDYSPLQRPFSPLPARQDVRAKINRERVKSLRVATVRERPEFKFQLLRGGRHVQVAVRRHRRLVCRVVAAAGRLADRLGDVLRADAACADYNIGNLLAADPPGVALIIVGVSGQKRVRNDAGGIAYGVGALVTLGAPGLAGGTVSSAVGVAD